MKSDIPHSGDCSIWISPICDCGELRRAASDGRMDLVAKDWCKHLAAIDNERDDGLKEIIEKAHLEDMKRRTQYLFHPPMD